MLKRYRIILWLLLSAYLALVVRYTWNPTPFSQALAAIGIALALAQAIYFYGWKDALIFFAICVAISFTFENLGVATGFPFGSYHFVVGAALPHVGAIPIIVGPLWFAMGYYAWMIAQTLLGTLNGKADFGRRVIFLPMLAALIETEWDLVMERSASTISHAWVWREGGADFGVPLSNYAGWLLTSWLFFLAFAIYCNYHRPKTPLPRSEIQTLQLAAIALFVAAGLTHLTPWLIGDSGRIADSAGVIWRKQDIREATVLVLGVTMLPTALLALLKLHGAKRKRRGVEAG